jgi:transposase
MDQFKFFVGIDVSKLCLDIAIYQPSEGIISRQQIANTVKEIRQFLKDVVSDKKSPQKDFLFCLENTGKYCHTFLKTSTLLEFKVWMELPIQIKRSTGMVRGKTDEWDAERIAQYAYRFQDKAVLWQPTDKTLLELKDLQTKRNLLVKSHSQLSQENKKDPVFKNPLAALAKAIEQVEKKMENLIMIDHRYKQQFELLKTVPGIGRQTAIALILTTKGFTRLTESRKLSCYAGLAPFPYRSGSSVRGRTKISKMGDMKLKSLLNLSAWNAIRSVPTLKEYYQRKVAEGKHKLSAINAVRNKLIAMALAVVKRNTPFVKEFSFT